MNTTQLTESIKLLDRIRDIDERLSICREVTSVSIDSHGSGFTVQYDTAKMYAAKISAELISTRHNLVEQYLRISGQVEADQ